MLLNDRIVDPASLSVLLALGRRDEADSAQIWVGIVVRNRTSRGVSAASQEEEDMYS